MIKKTVKYVILTICGVILFVIVNRAANIERPTASVGGEMFFLILPILWWVVGRTVKDLISEIKRKWREIKSKSGEVPQEHKQTTAEVTRND